MSNGEQSTYKVDYLQIVAEQIREIAGTAKESGHLKWFSDILKDAVHLLQTDPHGWGDPEYSTSPNGVVCHGIIRPVVFRYVVYEKVRGVVLLSVHLFTEFVTE